ncbi:MAG: isoprenylcysteine carboxylmethyltransferase family protein [Candidatus Lokiarchaeota archaeon]|nr:isoprenylcysteine carboxylmethyltransferase family protein [Candidatus Lokiarchaeota archaeon]
MGDFIMLDIFTFLFTVFSIWTLKFILPPIIKRIRGNNLPKGSIIITGNAPKNNKQIVGRRLSQLAVGFGILYSYIILIDLTFRYISGFWIYLFIINLPIWVNWIGLIGLWVLGVWVTLTFIYNVNYTACTSQMKEINYVLATSGPYKYVRHPAYIAGVFENLFIFLTTGAWTIFFGLIGFIALPHQAKEEEKILRVKFGEIYGDYASKTGRFFPKIKK